jgi:hypothetical protein
MAIGPDPFHIKASWLSPFDSVVKPEALSVFEGILVWQSIYLLYLLYALLWSKPGRGDEINIKW